MPSKFVRYLLAVHNVILLIIIYFLTDLGKGGTLEKLFSLIVISFFILSIATLIIGSVGVLGNDFWFTILFQIILIAVCLWMAISYISKETQLVLQILNQFNLHTAAYLYLIPGALLCLWTVLVFLKIRKANLAGVVK